MRNLVSFAIAVVILASQLQAGPFSENYQVMGTLTLDIDGHETTMYVPFDRARNRPFVRSQKMPDGSTVSITAASPTQTGAPGRPMVQFFLKFGGDNQPKSIVVRLSDGQGVSRPLLANSNIGASDITEFIVGDDGKNHVGFSATLVRVDVSQSQTEPLVLEGEAGASVHGVLDFYYEPAPQ